MEKQVNWGTVTMGREIDSDPRGTGGAVLRCVGCGHDPVWVLAGHF